MYTPKVSVIVPTLNHAPFIAQTLDSILGQLWPNLELIVIDGGSKDGAQEIVRSYGAAITHFISEPDKGQADAINKGMRLATGEIVCWLNSDDYFLPGTIKRVMRAIPDPSALSLVHGGTVTIHEQRGEASVWLGKPVTREGLTTGALVNQAGSFWTRALWERAGELDVRRHFVFDWEWYYRASAHCAFTLVPELLSVYRFHPTHKTSSGDQRRTKEIVDLVKEIASPEWAAAFQEVADRLPELIPGMTRLKKWGLWRCRTWVYRGLYQRHGARVKVALSQLWIP